MQKFSTKLKKIYFTDSYIFKSLRVLSVVDRKKLVAMTVVQSLLSVLDLLGIAAIGILIAVSFSDSTLTTPGGRVQKVISALQLDGIKTTDQILYLAIFAVIVLTLKTILSVNFTKKTLEFLSRRCAILSKEMANYIFRRQLSEIQAKSQHELIYTLTAGVNLLILGVIGTLYLLVTDFILLLLVITALFLADPTIALSSIAFFGIVAIAVYANLGTRARDLGKRNSNIAVEGNQLIFQLIEGFREIKVKGRTTFYLEKFSTNRDSAAESSAKTAFIPYIGKYLIESSMIVGIVAIAGIQFAIYDAYHAVSSLAIFMAAATRMAPAVLRIQQSAIQLRANQGASEMTLGLLDQLAIKKDIDVSPLAKTKFTTKHSKFEPKIVIENLFFLYPESTEPALTDINLKIIPGEFVAIVGPSGAGKSTLVDILLGVNNPKSGKVQISGTDPKDCIRQWPGAIGYVPQEVTLIPGGISENIGLGYDVNNDLQIAERIREVTKQVGLEELISNRYDTNESQNWTELKVSGGQRQRIGIARALISSPKLLVLDEATSSLDGANESLIAQLLLQDKGQVTVVAIAHRLSTIIHADRVVYMENGKIVSIGTFDEVRENVTNFDEQAKLLGL
jgi:ABC-type multidrug transport system fused ATPase/permease subunit